MDRSLIDRCTDTTAFRVLLLLAGLAVAPVLAVGVLITVMGGGAVLIEQSAVDLEQAVFALLSIGGTLGFVGYVRSHLGARSPGRHNVTATLLCLAAGILAALGVAAAAGAAAVTVWRAPWDDPVPAALLASFALANVAWALAGLAWMQRLLRRYAESTGRVFDTLPVVLLSVAIALAIAATLVTTDL